VPVSPAVQVPVLTAEFPAAGGSLTTRNSAAQTDAVLPGAGDEQAEER
jgi:hypothetical protein